LTITTFGEHERGSLRPRHWPGACCCCEDHVSFEDQWMVAPLCDE
jgi:hypothetical protein